MNQLIKLACFASLLACTGALLSCAETPETGYPATKSTVVHNNMNSGSNRVLLNAVSYQQTTSYTCGPAVIMSLMQHYGKLSTAEMTRQTEMKLATEMGTTSSGTTQTSMVSWLEKNGFHVQYGQDISIDMLMDNLRRHVPTIIIWNDWGGHALLVIGYYQQGNTLDNDKDMIFFVDPSSASNIVENNQTLTGINTITPNQLTFNEFNARYFFNPSHTAVGMYIVATPN
jgi:predicted double-glycine peptidase